MTPGMRGDAKASGVAATKAHIAIGFDRFGGYTLMLFETAVETAP